MPDPDVIVVADVHGLAGLASELSVLLDDLARSSCAAEADCLGFRVLTTADPGEFVLLSAYSSEAALRAHYATPHYRHYRDNVGPMLARPSDVTVHHVSATVHAVDPNPPDPGLMG
jgi:quinol monooxygenase YgiN